MTTTINRRRFVGGAAAMGAAATIPLGRSATARAQMNGRRVAVFGAGMAGLVCAHELVENGWEVDLYESRSVYGGKARSFGVPGTAGAGRKELPAEHGFRFFPGFYQHVTNSMIRTPAPGQRRGVLSALRSIDDLASDFDGYGAMISESKYNTMVNMIRLRDFQRLPDPNALARPEDVFRAVSTVFGGLAKPTTIKRGIELAWFAARVTAYVTACEERRKGPWDHVSWWKFMQADGRSTWFQNSLVKGTTMALVAVKPERCSVSSAGNIMDAFLWNLMGVDRGPLTAYALRFLDGPTSEVWIDPWVTHLKSLGVNFHPGQALTRFTMAGGRVASATVRGLDGQEREVQSDYYLSAAPIDKIRPILFGSSGLLDADPSLELLKDCQTEWMNGMQIYLKKPAKASAALGALFDHQWTISLVSQRQLWRRNIPNEFGDGTVSDIISIDISTWDRPGQITTTKAARDCTKEEIFREIWAALKERFAKHDPAFRDDNVKSWFLDPAIEFGPDGKVKGNDEPLTVQTVGTWLKRPKGETAIPNLYIAGDWIRASGNCISMETASQGARQCVRALLRDTGGTPENVFFGEELETPEYIKSLKREDKQRLDKGLPNKFDALVRGPNLGALRLPRL